MTSMLRGLNPLKHSRLETPLGRSHLSQLFRPRCPVSAPAYIRRRHQVPDRHIPCKCIDTANSEAPVSLQDAAADAKPKPVYRISPDEVQRLLASSNGQLSLEDLMRSLIGKAKEYALPVLSKFHVGAVGLGRSGALYLGHNVEFFNAPLNNSIHAEQFLLVNCLAHGEKEIETVIVSEAPCGHCRQFFCEISNADTVRFSFGSDRSFRSLDEILPGRFGPHDLLHRDITPLLTDQRHSCIPSNEARQAVLQRKGEPAFTSAAVAALRAAQTAYAPYTQCPAAVSIILKDGTIHTGSCVESAAFNPTISPFHAALILAIAGGMHDVRKIREVVLVEYSPVALKKRHAHIRFISYKLSIKLLLKAMSLPSVPVTVLGLNPADKPQMNAGDQNLNAKQRKSDDMQSWLDSYPR